jgi:uncharacterized membrane protein
MNKSMSMPGAAAIFVLAAINQTAQASSYELTQIGPLPGDTDGFAYFLSDDGKTAVIGSYNAATIRTRPAVWTELAGLIPLDRPGFESFEPAFLSHDGLLFAGTSCESADGSGECEAFVWTPSDGIQGLGYLDGDTYSRIGGPYSPVTSQFVVGQSCPSRFELEACKPFVWTSSSGPREIPPLPGKNLVIVVAVSEDASTLIGRACVRAPGNPIECEAFHFDVASDTTTGLGILPDFDQSEANTVSADGTAIAVNAFENLPGSTRMQAALWTTADGLIALGLPPGDVFSTSVANRVGAGPAVLVASSPNNNQVSHFSVWKPSTGLIELQPIGANHRALFLSRNGEIAIGDSFDQVSSLSVAWVAPQWNAEVLHLPGDIRSVFRVILENAAFGESGGGFGSEFYSRAFRWTRAEGVQPLGQLPNATEAIVNDATTDGSTAVGYQADRAFTQQPAFIWTEAHGVESLELLDGHMYGDAVAVSEDGNFILGTSGDDFRVQAVIWKRTESNEAATPIGEDVSVALEAGLPDGSPAGSLAIEFESVATAGTTSVTAASSPAGTPEAPTGFNIGDPPIYYDVSTTATFEGPVTLCFTWNEGQFQNESGIALFHFENSAWADVTTSVDTSQNRVCGQVTTFSPFALFELSYDFTGFFPPVDNLPIRNTVNAGSAVPIKFSLGGDRGLTIFEAGYPASQAISCNNGSPQDPVTETVSAGTSGLTYDVASDRYSYVWKTQKGWAKTCRRLILNFADGSQQVVEFGFPK